jgi:deazaflavin-dependent oxidoreductase (nitroreductase family)
VPEPQPQPEPLPEPLPAAPLAPGWSTPPPDYAGAARLHRMVRRVGGLKPVSLLLARTLHHLDRPVMRATHGRHNLTSLITGLTVGDLVTTGARSGRPRHVPVLGFPAEGGFVVIASNYGQQHHPAWYHNLLAHPTAHLTVDGVTTSVHAELTAGARRERIWAQALALYPSWARYAERAAHRTIGVFLLRPS